MIDDSSRLKTILLRLGRVPFLRDLLMASPLAHYFMTPIRLVADTKSGKRRLPRQ